MDKYQVVGYNLKPGRLPGDINSFGEAAVIGYADSLGDADRLRVSGKIIGWNIVLVFDTELKQQVDAQIGSLTKVPNQGVKQSA